ncbi:MAG: PASTA domain-containing protein [Saprospiraceae bacterium]|nr:PASTA domain-containing protein [Saprospiraceae bacterium]
MLNIKNEVLVRAYLVAAGLVGLAFVIFLRMFQLSVKDAAKWEAKADSLYVKWVDAPSQRGNILADDGSLLATSLPFFDVHFDAKAEGLTDQIFNDQAVDSLGWLISTYVDQQYTPGAYAAWLRRLRDSTEATARGIRYVPIAKNLPYAKAMQIKNFPIFREGRYKGGFIMEQVNKRERPFKLLAQRTIGYTREGALPVGLEGSFNNVLEGNEGKQLMIRVPGDVYIPINDLAEIEPEAGDDVVTTLDINIQDVAENSLLSACQTHNADHGCAIVMEVKTGKIRAMANIGRTPDGWWETYNYAVGERVEPGSMFKLASFMAMMEEGKLDNFDEKIPVYGGKVNIYDEELVDAVPHGLDSMTIKQVFAQSSNVGTATLTQQFFKGNPSAFYEHLLDFGLHLPTDIEVGGEEAPIVKNPKDPKSEWSGTTLPWMSIGYELLLTPMQLLTFYNAVANNGRMMKPYLVQRTERYGEVIKEFHPTVVKKSIASNSTIKKAHELLREVVISGTAKNIMPANYTIAGKTGTAQLNYHKFQASKGIRHQAGFCGFFPADNPVYSCIVVISEPERGGYHGAEVAAPVFRAIADRCFAMKAELHPPINKNKAPKLASSQLPTYDAGLRKDVKESLRWLGLDFFRVDEKGEDSEWSVIVAQSGDSLVMKNRVVPDKTIPSVVGMGLKDAMYLLENRGCKVRVVGVGKVRRQSISPGSHASGQTCVLYLE